jgi:hypothetical protein
MVSMIMTQYIKPQIKWTPEKINLLREKYPSGNKNSLAENLGITRKTLKEAARRFKVRSPRNKFKLKPLYDNTNLAYYWMGFITADGYISPKNKELVVALSIKDKSHLDKLSLFLNTMTKFFEQGSRKYCLLTCADSHYGELIMDKFGFDGTPKTYNPPKNLKFPNKELFLSYLIGMIDGDGCFCKTKIGNFSGIKIELHGSWLGFLRKIQSILDDLKISTTLKLNKRGYALFRIDRFSNSVFLKMFAIRNSLPILERKWSFIDTNKIINYKKEFKSSTSILPENEESE